MDANEGPCGCPGEVRYRNALEVIADAIGRLPAVPDGNIAAMDRVLTLCHKTAEAALSVPK